MSSKNYQVFWQEALKQISEQYKAENKEAEFNIWFKMDYVEDESNVIKVNVPSQFMKEQIISRGYTTEIKNKLIQITGQPDFVIEMNIAQTPIASINSQSNQSSQPSKENENSQIQTKENLNNQSIKTAKFENSELANLAKNAVDDYDDSSDKFSKNLENLKTESAQNSTKIQQEENIANQEFQHPQLMKRFQFSNFVPGENNNYAYSVALAAAQHPGKDYNPILFYGGVGLGKTHLMQSIGNYIYNERKGKVKLCFISSENWLNEFTDSIKSNTTQKFKNKYRNFDVFLLDDIHFLQNKDALQEECFHTFNALIEHGAQMVFTCDRHPSELPKFSDRLKSRFGSGVCIDLKPPSYENRIAIIKKKLETENENINPEIISFIAKNIQNNVRELEACIKKVLGYQNLINSDITLDIVKDLLKDSITGEVEASVSIETIFKVVAKETNTTITDIKGEKRTKQITEARHIAIYIARELLEYSYPELAVEFGGKNHSTLISAYQKLENRIKLDPNFDARVKLIMEEIKNYKVQQP